MNVSRNDPCPCGSGLKFKRCCGKAPEHVVRLVGATLSPPPRDVDFVVALFHSGRYAEVESRARELIERYPNAGLAWKLLAATLSMQGKDALPTLRNAAKFLPDDAEVYNELGNALNLLGDFDAAIANYRRAVEISPDFFMAYNNLGTVLQVIGDFHGAAANYQLALAIKPSYVDAHYNFGIVLKRLGRVEDAIVSYRNALSLRVDDVDALYNLGIALQEVGRIEEAEHSYRRALVLQPDFAEAHNNLGNILRDIGRLDASVACFRQALAMRPDNLYINRGFLMTMLYRPAMTLEQLFDEHLAAAARLCAQIPTAHHAFDNVRDPDRKLRIGYVSSDFRDHPVGRNMMPLIKSHDRGKAEVYLYGDVKRTDGMTEWFQGAVDGWRSINGITDGEAADIIRRDEIDVLVVLAARFDGNRPLIAAYRAAPVQVSFHDPATSGFAAMDYLIGDPNLCPRQTRERFTERVVRLPTFYVHQPLRDAPEVSALPQRQKGYVTFGSFNNPAKVNERVVTLWSQVLKAVPGSKLLLKYKEGFGGDSAKAHYRTLFEAAGVSLERVVLVGADEEISQHLGRYSEIDIALDTFPFSGSTTTFEALWMGVPVVTLLGDRMVARWSGAMLKKLGLDDLVASDEEEYVAIARGLAQNPDRLESLRAGLRERVAQSPLCDETRRAAQVERLFRWMWAKWCVGQTS